MRKIILITISSILIFLLFFIIYFSVYGIKTDNFNNFINNKVKSYNPNLILKLDDVYVKLNLSQISINIYTKDAILIAENKKLKISDIEINLNIINFINNKNSIKNIKLESAENSIKDVIALLNSINYDFSRVIYSQIEKGFINFKLDIEFDSINQNINSYLVSGSVNEAKFNLNGRDNIDVINFDFEAKDKLTKISNLNLIYHNLNIFSEEIEIINEEAGSYFVKGNIENSKASINLNNLLKINNIKQEFLSNKKIPFKSKNFFSFRFNNKKKFKNIKIDSIINFDEIYFNNNYQNLIYLKNGTINSKYENNKFTGDIISNFAFRDELKLKNNYKNNNLKFSFKSKINQMIEVNGYIKNDETLINSKILLNEFKLDPNLLSDENIKIKTDNQIKFEIRNNRIENYLVNSTINLDKLEFNKEIQDILYFKNVKTELTFGNELLKLDLKSNYSFNNKNYNNKLDNNIFNLKLDKANSKISDVEIFLNTRNNNINTQEFKKYLNLQNEFVEDQIINLNSNFIINFSIDDKFNIKELAVRSDLNFDNFNINYKSNIITKYLENYENKLIIKKPNISFEYSNNIINFQLNGKYSLNKKVDNLFVKFTGNKNNFKFYSLLDLDNNILNISEIQYYKNNSTPSKLEILINNSQKGSNIEKINFTENENFIKIKNLEISDKLKIKSVDEINLNFLNQNRILNNFEIKKNSNNYNLVGQHIDGEKLVERLLKNNKKNKISRFFENISTSITLNLNKIHLEKNSYLEKIVGEFDIKNNKLFLGRVDAVLKNKKKFTYSYRTTAKNEKITNIFIEEPKPFINNYKFIKGFDEGELNLNSIKIDSTSRSNLKIINFKVKEVPVLAKILTLASLQGIADLLTGEGIRFDEFEMDYKTTGNLTEIIEMYALGPAISIMMEGYIEKDRVTSLKGTLVPATTINKTIAKIPLLGNILVGKKVGEGVFGVSFKIKGPPNDLKSTVNPIKTLTPRFITRTLEKIKGN